MRKSSFTLVTALAVLAASGCQLDNTYGFCSSTADCNDLDDICYDVSLSTTLGSFCSRTCSDDAQCEPNRGFAGRCYSIEGTDFLCYQTCDFDRDCYASSVCIEVALSPGLVDFICVPDN